MHTGCTVCSIEVTLMTCHYDPGEGHVGGNANHPWRRSAISFAHQYPYGIVIAVHGLFGMPAATARGQRTGVRVEGSVMP
jgi:hypothetical protein